MVPLTGDGVSQLVLSGPLLLAVLIAVAAGAVSFFSPCCLPLVPGYLSYVAGQSGAEAETAGLPSQPRQAAAFTAASTGPLVATVAAPVIRAAPKSGTVLGAMLFVTGFALVFTGYGALFGAVGSWLMIYQTQLIQVLGFLTIILGLMFTGILTRVPLLGQTFRLPYEPRTGLLGAPVLGVLFGLGWTPCIGPTLAAVLTLSTTTANAGRGAVLSFAYSAGLGLPFILAAASMQKMLTTLGWARRHARVIMRLGGAMLIVLGLLQVTGAWRYVIASLQGLISGWQVPL